MKTILYIHGFCSAGSSGTVVLLRNILYGADVRVLAPDVPVMPAEAIVLLRDLVEKERPDLIIGTSMGGMYAEMLRGYKRILVNPSFHMARLLTFRGLGKYRFLNKRQDGSKDFKVDKTMIAQFRELEKQSFQGLDDEDRKNVYGLFGKNDPTVHTQEDFTRHYGTSHFIVFEGEHRLNDDILKKAVLPIIKEVLSLS